MARWFSPRIAAFAALVCIGLTSVASADGLQVSPTRVHLSAKTKTSALELANDGSSTIRVQATAYKWRQSPAGEVMLEPTNEIVVFPTLFALDPGKTRSVRVGTKAGATSTEKSYRIVIEELPPLRQASDGDGVKIQVLTRMSIPVFVQPPKARAKGAIDSVAITDGHLSFDVSNVGTGYTMVREVRIVARDAGGRVAFERSVPGWYLLAGGRWHVDVALEAATCATIDAVELEVTSDQDTWGSRAEVATPRC